MDFYRSENRSENDSSKVLLDSKIFDWEDNKLEMATIKSLLGGLDEWVEYTTIFLLLEWVNAPRSLGESNIS